jgi:TonB family protein
MRSLSGAILFAGPIFAAAALSFCGGQDPGQSTPQPPAVHYENSVNGLKQLTQDAVQAAKDGNQSKLLELSSTMILPDSDKWFKNVFGDSFGITYAQKYATGRDNLRVILANTFLSLVQNGFTKFEVYRFAGNCDKAVTGEEFDILVARVRTEPLSVIRFTNGNEIRTLRYFVYADDGFRFLENLGLPRWSDPPSKDGPPVKIDASDVPSRIQLSGDVQNAKLVNRVVPIYPMDARQHGIQGTVRIHAVISRQGKVFEMRWESGPCILAEPAFRAVAQWRFKPTTLNGIPVEVDTTFDVNFKMSR